MKRLVAAFFLFALALSIALAGHFYIRSSAKKMIEFFEKDRSLTVADGMSSHDRAEKIQNEWNKRETLFVAILPHSELDEIEINIMHLTDFNSQGLTEEYIKSLNECINRLEHIRETENIDFKNIF